MQAGDFVSIDYVGRVKGTGEIFDLTDAELAKKEKIYSENVRYGPITVVVDAGFVIKGLDDALREMKVGEKRKVEVSPDKAFGERRADFIKLIPMSNFKQQDITPEPGSYVTINGFRGRVISTDGGRVRIDFNHPLAGKDLEYELEVKGVITDVKEKIISIVHYFTNSDKERIGAKISSKEVEISVKDEKEIHGHTKKDIADTIKKWVKEIEAVKFVDAY